MLAGTLANFVTATGAAHDVLDVPAEAGRLALERLTVDAATLGPVAGLGEDRLLFFTATRGTQLAQPAPLVVPILRAGLGMLEGMLRLVPSAEVGFLGMIRDEETLEPMTYAERLPNDLSGRQCYVLDPMLATGGSLAGTVQFLVNRGADHITCICLIAAPEGIERMRTLLDGIGVPCTLVVAAQDERLNEVGYIVPGLGDAGDRLYGLAQ